MNLSFDFFKLTWFDVPDEAIFLFLKLLSLDTSSDSYSSSSSSYSYPDSLSDC
jgi:hypothetical protein